MAEALLFTSTLLKMYIIPLFYALGLVFLLYGVIKHFILEIGGKDFLLRSCLMFFIGLVLFGVATSLDWLSRLDLSPASEQGVVGTGGAQINSDGGLLNVPNTPRSR